MEKIICGRIRLKPGSLPRVREWAAHIAANKDAALRTLNNEGVAIESVFLDSNDEDTDYLIYYMRAASLEKAAEVVSKSIDDIDLYHAQFKQDTWEQVVSLEMLVDLINT